MRINRRRFLQGGALAAAAAGVPHPIKRALFGPRSAQAAPADAIFVLLQWEGGNDGLNTVIPTDDVGPGGPRQLYETARPNLGVPSASLLGMEIDPDPVHGTGLAFHPALAPLKSLYDAGRVAVVNGVAYPGQSLSHFRSEDIWFGGIASSAPFAEGWFGRFLDERFPGGELVTVDVDRNLSKNFLCTGCNVLAISSLAEFQIPDDPAFPDLAAKRAALQGAYAVESDPASTSGVQLTIGLSGDVLLGKVDEYAAVETQWSSNLDAVGGRTARRLKQAASIIRHDALNPGSGVGARFFHVRRGGFDTHTGQTDEGANGLAGRQAELLDEMARLIKAFYDDMAALGVSDRVVLMTQSEFGRRVAENGGFGTDHGEASVLFAVGDPVLGGVYGELPPLDDLDRGNLRWRVDFRQVYATIIDDWLGADHTSILGGSFAKLGFIA